MDTFNDHVQYQMLLDVLNLNNNSFVCLPFEYYHSCFPAFTNYSYAAADGDSDNAHYILLLMLPIF
jgi:hypothetical protein